MLVAVKLDNELSHYTNLDFISGKVYLRVQSATSNISTIVVKLEGESRTRLVAVDATERSRAPVEIHKVILAYNFIPSHLSKSCTECQTADIISDSDRLPSRWRL